MEEAPIATSERRRPVPRQLLLVGGAILASLVVAAGVWLATLSGSGTRYDQQEIESLITAGLRDQGIHMAVTCPSTVEFRSGREFQCTGTREGANFVVDVQVQNDKGEFVWSVR